MLIIGAGLAGLIASHAWPQARIIEAEPVGASHKALLRFRSDAVSKLTGIPFREVTVRKGIWSSQQGAFVPPDIRLANLYAQKCLGGPILGDRSIWDLTPVKRFIAPEDFYDQLVAQTAGRVEWERPFHPSDAEDQPIVSTMPLPVALRTFIVPAPPAVEFHRAPIVVQRFRVPGAELFQTIYFPEPVHNLYRASITGDLLILEFAAHAEPPGFVVSTDAVEDARRAFGLDGVALSPLSSTSQRFGKIAPIPAAARKAALFGLTSQRGVFSLGRFATWRNILLDDVVNDIAVIKQLMRAGAYDIRRAAS